MAAKGDAYAHRSVLDSAHALVSSCYLGRHILEYLYCVTAEWTNHENHKI